MDGDLLDLADIGASGEPLGSQQSTGSWVETLSSLQPNVAQEATDNSHDDATPQDIVHSPNAPQRSEPERCPADVPNRSEPDIGNEHDASSSESFESESDRDFLFEDTSSYGSADEDEEHDDGGDYNGYSFMDSDVFSLVKRFSINYIDEYLGPMFQKEVQTIYDRLALRLGSMTNASRAKPSDLLEVLLVAERGKQGTNCDEFRVRLLAYLRAAVYSVNLSTTFDVRNTRWYGLASQFPITLNRCLDVLKALSGTSTTATDERWELLNSETKRFFSFVEEKVTEINVDLFLTDQAVLSVDDDHIRQRSRKVQKETNLKVVNNPKKALGPVQTACTSALTGFFISGHYAVIHENTRATFEKLFMYIQGARHPSDIHEMREIIIAADRGYLNSETVMFICHVLCAKVIGTHKRAHGFPFVYGSGGICRHHRGMVIPDKGGRAVFYATKKLRSNSKPYKPPVFLSAIAYREAVNWRVALFLTSIEDFATGWSTVPRNIHATTEPDENEILEGFNPSLRK